MKKVHLFLFVCFCTTAVGQVAQVEFGKNRVQHHQDFEQWLSYESQNFITYWYGLSKNVGNKSAQIAESVYEDVVSTIEFRINDKIELVVYADVTDVKMTNIGSDEILQGRAGRTTIERNKIFVYFDGDHRNLRKQIREGVAAVFINYMLYGSEIQEIMQNMVALGLPEWFQQGLVAFIGDHWSEIPDNALRDALSERPYKNFEQFARDHPRLAGHAFWLYVSLNYGKAEIGNLLYYIRINRNLDNALSYVFNQSYDNLLNNTWTFMHQLTGQEIELEEAFLEIERLDIRNRKKVPYTDISINPTAPYIAYTWNQQGKLRVYLHDMRNGKDKRILRSGYRNSLQETDYNYPLLSWHPNGKLLAIMHERRDKIYLTIYDLTTDKKEVQLIPNRYQRIYAMDWWNDDTMIFSASEVNFSDLYLYRILNRSSTQLTNDVFDDAHVTTGYYNDVKGVFFSSNRNTLQIDKISPDTIVPLGDMNIYFLDPESERDSVIQITREDKVDHTHVKYTSTGDLHFLSNGNGIINRKVLRAGADQAIYLTDYPRSIIDYDVHHGKNMVADIVKFRNTPQILVQELSQQQEQTPAKTAFFQYYKGTVSRRVTGKQTISGFPLKSAPLKPVKRDTIRETNPDYFFQSPFDDMDEKEDKKELIPEFSVSDLAPKMDNIESIAKQPRFEKINPMRVTPYRLRFRIDYVNTTVDNNPLFEGLESYAGTGEVVYNNPMGLLFKANLKDLMEDYQIEGGIRIPTTFNGAEYFLLFDDRKKKLNKRYALYRRANYNNEGFIGNVTLRNRKEILLGQYQLRYPLDVFTSIRGIATLRQDRFTRLASERNSLNEPADVDQRAGLRLEYVFDNTMPIDMNILNGTRYKFYAEAVKRFDIQFIDGFNFDLGEGFMTIIGFDARHYVPILRHSVLALRAAGATSFGSEKLLYLLGGADNTVIPSFNNNIPLPTGDDFALQTLAPNLRGFDNGIRNGNSYALINTELRIPIFKYLFRRPIRSSFIRNFQIVGFADAGTAWQGVSPFNRDNPLNTIDLESPTIRVRVNYFRDPIVMGYGVGVRTMIFGYFIRVDYARGYETKTFLRPKFHIALGMDF